MKNVFSQKLQNAVNWFNYNQTLVFFYFLCTNWDFLDKFVTKNSEEEANQGIFIIKKLNQIFKFLSVSGIYVWKSSNLAWLLDNRRKYFIQIEVKVIFILSEFFKKT